MTADLAPSVSEVLAELRTRGADRRTASPELRAAFADLVRQETAPDFFLSASLAAALAAIEADTPRFESERAELQRKELRQSARMRLRRDRRQTQSASCCLYYYSRSAADHSYWRTCHRCKQPLVYVSPK
jgi:hypothetical protein